VVVISEYFDGKENSGSIAVLRTHPDQRSGYYFLVRTSNPGAARSIKASLEVITAANPKPVAYSFPGELKSPRHREKLPLGKARGEVTHEQAGLE
jgi:hypothetical protein